MRQREVKAEREVQIASIEQQRANQLTEQQKAISLAQKSEEQSKAQASANLALADAVKSERAVKTAEEVAKAEREKQVTLVLTCQEAERQAISVKVSALAEKKASEGRWSQYRRRPRCGDGVPSGSSGNLAEQARGAALKYRAYAPLVYQLIKEVGLSGDGPSGLVKVATPAPASVPAVPAQA